MRGKDLLCIRDLSAADVRKIIDEMLRIKKTRKLKKTLAGKNVAMVFEKPSTRTRLSFEVAIDKLGGNAIYFSPRDTQLARGETIADTAKTLERYVDAIVARVYSHNTLVELAKSAEIPVINALSDFSHPCQALADVVTMIEKKGDLKKLKIAWCGDGTNVCSSLIFAADKIGFKIHVATPEKYKPHALALETGAARWTADPIEAVKGADFIHTDTWVSMGEEKEREARLRVFKPYQVNAALVKHAKPDYLFMHCLPAHRGEEVAAEIIDGSHSIVFDQAENRLWAQIAILSLIL